MSIQNVKLRVTQGYSRIGYQQWENTVIPIYWSRDVHAPGKIYFSARTNFKQDYEPDSLFKMYPSFHQ